MVVSESAVRPDESGSEPEQRDSRGSKKSATRCASILYKDNSCVHAFMSCVSGRVLYEAKACAGGYVALKVTTLSPTPWAGNGFRRQDSNVQVTRCHFCGRDEPSHGFKTVCVDFPASQLLH